MFPKFSLREPAEAVLAEHVAQVCLRPGELGGRNEARSSWVKLGRGIGVAWALS